ncbi:MAG: BCCT family transporter [Paracoccaceae bacterium]|nr:BCCT family transporter [Paracoccaceae bacterium]
MSMLIMVLLMTYRATSANSAVLIFNMIADSSEKSLKVSVHIITFGVALLLVIACLLLTKGDGLSVINAAMIIGAFWFSGATALMGVALIKALLRDGMHNAGEAEPSAELTE